MGDNRPSVYEREDGKIVYRSSDIGGCLIRLAAARQGLHKNEPREGGRVAAVFEAGNEAEDKFFKENPDLAHYRQLEVVLPITNTVIVVGHLDAFVDGLIEVKSQSDKEFMEWTWDCWTDHKLWVKYSWQVSVCMLGLGGDYGARVIRYNRDKGVWTTEIVKQPFWTKEQVIERILEVESLACEDRLVCNTPDFFCPYPFLHSGPEPVIDDRMEGLVSRYLQLKTMSDRVGGELKECKEEISKHLSTMESDKVLLMSGRTVSRTMVTTKEHTVKGSSYERITVSEVK